MKSKGCLHPFPPLRASVSTHTQAFPVGISEHATQYLATFGARPVERHLHTLHGAHCFPHAPDRFEMGRVVCFSHSGVLEVMGALDWFRGVSGGAEHFEDPDAFKRVPAGVASRGPSNSFTMSCEGNGAARRGR